MHPLPRCAFLPSIVAAGVHELRPRPEVRIEHLQHKGVLVQLVRVELGDVRRWTMKKVAWPLVHSSSSASGRVGPTRLLQLFRLVSALFNLLSFWDHKVRDLLEYLYILDAFNDQEPVAVESVEGEEERLGGELTSFELCGGRRE